MWISKERYIALERENGSLSATIESKIEVTKRLEREISYWRDKFESAQNRADRVSDLAFETSGFRPISDLGISERKDAIKSAKEYEKAQEDMAREMYADEINTDDNELPVTGLIDDDLLQALKESVT
jgi:hypothetical protein